jgi:hypothetical protein
MHHLKTIKFKLDMKNIEKPYLDSILEVTKQLKLSHDAFSSYKFDLSKSDITEAIIFRLQAFYLAQNEIKQLLKKGYGAAASDFFVETILFFTKVYLNQQAPHLEVTSEKECNTLIISDHWLSLKIKT